jgi:hypothetical protein
MFDEFGGAAMQPISKEAELTLARNIVNEFVNNIVQWEESFLWVRSRSDGTLQVNYLETEDLEYSKVKLEIVRYRKPSWFEKLTGNNFHESVAGRPGPWLIEDRSYLHFDLDEITSKMVRDNEIEWYEVRSKNIVTQTQEAERKERISKLRSAWNQL